MKKKMVLYLFNALITPIPQKDAEALVRIKKINPDIAKQIINTNNGNFVSAIGHPATAQLLSLLLGVEIPTNRVQVFLQPGDGAIALVLKTRLPEGTVLNSIDQISQIGYDLYFIQRLS
ncbi:MAG: STIV orfB116 family protein [Thermoproteota archaeon]